MIIKSFSILDYSNKEAVSYDFSNKVNLIVSSNNSMGKSSLLKSLYYTLGFSIKHFPSEWNHKDMYFQIRVSINNKEHIISRQNSIFKVDDNDKPLTEREYSDWLQDQLGIDMQLPNAKTKELHKAYSSAVILPFYIDQDDSWDGNMYRYVSNALGQYSRIPQSIFEYLFNLSDVKIQELQNKINTKNSELKIVNSNIDSLNRLIDKYHKDLSTIPSIDKDKLNKEIDFYLKTLNKYNEDVKKFKVKLINDQEILDKQKQELAELDNLLRLNNKRIKAIEFNCDYCHSNLTEEQSLTRFNLSNNKFEIEYLRDEIRQNINKLEDKVNNTYSQKLNIDQKIDKITTNINQSKEMLTIDEYVNAKAKTLAEQEMNEFIQLETVNKATYNQEIKDLKAQVQKLKKEKLNLKNEITTLYHSHLNDIKKFIHDIDTNELDFLSFKAVKGSGVNKNKINFAYYLVYMTLIDEFGTYKLPFCMDSFIKNEITTESAKQMFKAMEEYLFKTENQVFFSLIEQNKKYLKNLEKYNIIDIKKRLLSKDKFEEISSQIFK